MQVLADVFDHLLGGAALEAALVLLGERVVPVLDHVFGSPAVHGLANLGPLGAQLGSQREQLAVLLRAPLLVVDGGVQVVEPLLPALMRGAEEPLPGPAEQRVGDIAPPACELGVAA